MDLEWNTSTRRLCVASGCDVRAVLGGSRCVSRLGADHACSCFLFQEELNATDVAGYVQRLRHEAMYKQSLMPDVMATDVHYLTSILQRRLLPLAFASETVSLHTVASL